MGGMDDLFKSMEMFKQGAQEYQQTQAVNDARTQLNTLQQQQVQQGATDQASHEYQMKQQQIGQDLALRLTAVHAGPLNIQAATSGLVPSASEVAQVQGGLKLEGLKTAGAKEVANIHGASAENVARIHAAAILGKDANKEKNALGKVADAFAKQPQVQPVLKGMSALNDSLVNFDAASAAGMGQTMATNLAKMGTLKAAVSRVTDREFQAADESPSVRASIWKKMGLESTGEVPQNIQTFWKSVIQAHKDQAEKYLADQAKGYAHGKAMLNDNVDEEKLHGAIRSQIGLGAAKVPDDAAKSEAAAWLNDANNFNHPDYLATLKEYNKRYGPVK